MAKRIAAIGKACVACGNCVSACPTGAISIYKGLKAVVDAACCVGCGKCEQVCPAGIIEIEERQGDSL
ncbi:NAD-dependent dihydropyrimidine dehydrogenase PreA subunit [Lachnospiraceae bacterium PF1-21]